MMKLGSMRYLTREGFRSLWQNRFMAIASICVLICCLLLTGGAYLVFVNIDNAFDWVYSQNVVVAFTIEDFPEERREDVRTQIINIAPDEISAELMTKEYLLDSYSDVFPDGVAGNLEDDNPLPDAFIITFKDVSKQSSYVTKIENLPDIEEVSHNDSIASMLTKTRDVIMLIGGWIIVLLMLVSLFIISNTIKLTVYNRRLEISIMKSVGATNAFVRIPFIIEGVLLGLIAALLSYGATWLIYDRLSHMFRSGIGMFKAIVSFSSVWTIILTAYLAIGILMGIVGSAFSTEKYLKDEGGISGVI